MVTGAGGDNGGEERQGGRDRNREHGAGSEETGMKAGEIEQQLRTDSVWPRICFPAPGSGSSQPPVTLALGDSCILFWPPGGVVLMDTLTLTLIY